MMKHTPDSAFSYMYSIHDTPITTTKKLNSRHLFGLQVEIQVKLYKSNSLTMSDFMTHDKQNFFFIFSLFIHSIEIVVIVDGDGGCIINFYSLHCGYRCY